MTTAVLSDIHANHVALSAVLKEAKTIGISNLFILGDFVGYYYHPDKVFTLLEPWEKTMIKGNHEDLLQRALEDPGERKCIKEKYGSGIEYAISKLNEVTLQTLFELPYSRQIYKDSIRIGLYHGSPRHHNEYIYPDTYPAKLDSLIDGSVDFILIGHSHYPFIYTKSQAKIVNVGSVGQPRDKGGYASWAVLDTEERTVELKKTHYNTFNIIEEIKNIDKEIEYLHKVLVR